MVGTLALCGLLLAACESESGEAEGDVRPASTRTEAVKQLAWEPAEVVELDGDRAVGAGARPLGEPQTYPPCGELLETDGVWAETFPLESAEIAPALTSCGSDACSSLGCGVEAYRHDDDGRWVAWRIESDDETDRDLRVAAYGPDDRLRWSWRLDRSRFSANFRSNFRESFVTPLWPRLVCVGTLWEGRTQVACLSAKDGSVEWDGVLDFRVALPFGAHETSLVGADRRGLTRRYPYSGVEMRRREFESTGGPGATYATDGDRMFFVPKQGYEPTLTAWSLETFNPVWRLELPARPDAGFGAEVFGRHDVLVVKIDGTLHAFDTSSGEALWAAGIRDRKPSIAADSRALHVLGQRETGDNVLWTLDPRTGDILEQGSVPAGFLEVRALEDVVVLKAVRAVQRLKGGPGGER